MIQEEKISEMMRNMPLLERNISKNIRLLRLLHNFSQEYISESLQMSPSHYSAIENGLRAPTFEMLFMLSVFYEINLEYIMTFDVSKHIISLLKINTIETDTFHFLSKYLSLSKERRIEIKNDLRRLENE